MTLSFITTSPPVFRPRRAASPAWDGDLHAKADREAPGLAARLRLALSVQMPGESLLAHRNVAVVVNAIDWQAFDARLARALLPSLVVLYQHGATRGAQVLGNSRNKGRAFADRLALNFNLKNPKSIEWIRRQAAARVKDISDVSRQAVRDLIEMSFRDGVPPRVLARQLRDYVGLDTRYARAAYNYEQGLKESGYSDLDVEKLAGKYADRLLRSRADRIARTETSTASHQGQRLLWQDAVSSGLLGNDARRVWIASPDACDDCQDLDGETADIDGEYEGGVDGPPLHPSCRCAEGLEFSGGSGGSVEVERMSRDDAEALAGEIADSMEE